MRLPPPASDGPAAGPREILDAALDLFLEKDFAATKLEDVASRAAEQDHTIAKGSYKVTLTEAQAPRATSA